MPRRFLVYIDGRLAATMPPVDFNTSGADAASFEVDGGNPLQLGRGAIYLCGRADNAPDRHFTGAVTHLALYNDILTPLEIRMLFTQARRGRSRVSYAQLERIRMFEGCNGRR
jgi:hypothetical protein